MAEAGAASDPTAAQRAALIMALTRAHGPLTPAMGPFNPTRPIYPNAPPMQQPPMTLPPGWRTPL